MDMGSVLIGSGIEVVVLLVVIPIAQKLADFSMPGFGEMVWKLALVVVLKNIVGAGVGMAAGGFAGSIGGAIVFWGGLWKIFDLDIFGAITIVVISWFLQMFVVTALLGMIMTAT